MSIIRLEYIWISAESKEGLNKKRCDSIAKHDVTLFPNGGCFDLWKGKGDQYGFNTTKEVELLMQKVYIKDLDDIALMDSAYGRVKQNVEITEGETPIFKQLDLDVID